MHLQGASEPKQFSSRMFPSMKWTASLWSLLGFFRFKAFDQKSLYGQNAPVFFYETFIIVQNVQTVIPFWKCVTNKMNRVEMYDMLLYDNGDRSWDECISANDFYLEMVNWRSYTDL